MPTFTHAEVGRMSVTTARATHGVPIQPQMFARYRDRA
jgi:hypothetical protein